MQIGLGLILIAAAGLKLYGLQIQPFAQHGLLLNESVRMAIVEWEIVLGLWLISGYARAGAWFAATLTFLAFAMVSFRLATAGVTSCGCFGAIEASPWHAFAVDAAALALLGIARPSLGSIRNNLRTNLTSLLLPGVVLAGAAAVTGATLLGLAALTFGSADAALASLRREPLSIRPRPVDVGLGQPNQLVETQVQIANHADCPVRIIGGTSDCSCVVTDDLPIALDPNEVRSLTVRIRLARTPGFFAHKAVLWTDNDQQRFIVLTLTGRVESPQED
jgi:hypothetical protein